MRQVLQNLKTGRTELLDVPCPVPAPGTLLIRTRRSLISAGTERMVVDFSSASLLEKARQQPDRVKQVLTRARTDGVVATIEAVRSRLDQGLPMGYCNVGSVIGVGDCVTDYAIGDRVVSNGRHAEVVCVPVNLCAKIPDGVSDDEAAFTVIGAIALQGLRLAQPTLGETAVVIGLGLVGLMCVQLLRASGCRVLGIDKDPNRTELARAFGASTCDLARGEDPISIAADITQGLGVDFVLVAAATDSSDPISQAATMCRKRGRIVLVGVTGLELSRADFYAKELTFQVSCSYGPGRYDPAYEQAGRDYPIGFVRWTEQRNFTAVLDMLAQKRVDVAPLISERYALDRADEAYSSLGETPAPIGILLEYVDEAARSDRDLMDAVVGVEVETVGAGTGEPPALAFIGAGNYANRILIPAFRKTRAHLRTIASQGGLSGAQSRQRFGFVYATTDVDAVLGDPEIDAVVVATRHDSHAELVIRALEAGKHVFAEKPLCLTTSELERIEHVYQTVSVRSASTSEHPMRPVLMVGFNRRFAPQVRKIKSLLSSLTGPMSFIVTVNAGRLPADHWTQQASVGGGRVIGEACHFLDLLRFLAGSPITVANRHALRATPQDTVTLELAFADGSIGSIHYFANGSTSFPKERVEVFASGRVLQLDNFRVLRGFGWPDFAVSKLWRQDKGQIDCASAFINAIVEGGEPPIPSSEIFEVSRLAIDLSR